MITTVNPPVTITFLGTGTSSGVPMIGCDCEVCTSEYPKDNRLRSSILVQSATTTFVIDTTPDFRYQMLRTNTKKLDAVLFTHPHKDHVAGLDDIRAYNYFQEKPMAVYANTLTQETLLNDFHYAFAEIKYPGLPRIDLHTIDETPFTIGDIAITPIKVWHMKMVVLGFRMGNFTYITDANRIDDAEREKIKGSKILVLNALRKEAHLSHFTLAEAVEVANELQVPQVFLTHISHQLGLHHTINAELPSHIQLSYDGMTFSI
ncbi:MAG: MBL fold metallo-hydrolase [Deinococcales bacterium]|nr:MBL fold metallo-hydrolase [Chitinophagaceae bacterium]